MYPPPPHRMAATSPRVQHLRLRPMGVGDILDETFRLYRENFLLVFGIVAVLFVPFLVAMVVVGAVVALSVSSSSLGHLLTAPSDTLTPAQTTTIIVILAVAGPVIVFALLAVYGLMTAALAVAIAQRYLQRPVTLGRAYAASFRRLGPLLLAIIWAFIRFVILIAVDVAVVVLLSAAHLTALGVLLALCSIAPVLYFGVAWWLIPQTVVLENAGPGRASGRSRRLVTGYWWKAFGVYIVVTILTNIVSGIPPAIAGAILGAVSGSADVSAATNAITTLVTIVLAQPVPIIVATLLFYDLKIRKEAFDLETLAQQQQATLSFPPHPAVQQ